MTTDHEIIDEALYRAILHGVAAGACRVAARETGSAYWAGMAEDQREKAEVLLHQAASADAPDRFGFKGLGQADMGMPSSASMRRANLRDGDRRPLAKS